MCSFFFIENKNSTHFCEILIQHLYEVLQEHDQLREDEKCWVLNEARNPKSLQYGGTFHNVLSRKIDDIIIPIFSKIIASIDHNCNLNLIDPFIKDSSLSQFWLQMFGNSDIMQFNYTDIVTPRDQVADFSGRMVGNDFECQFPFSWLVYEAIESQWDNAKSYAGNE